MLYYSRCEVVIRQENLSNMSCVPYENTMQIYKKIPITKCFCANLHNFL